MAYIEAHPEINNVILSGGDPLLLNHRRLRALMRRVAAIPHVRIIRLGTKSVAFQPEIVIESTELTTAIQEVSGVGKVVYVLTHFDHPREITANALRAVHRLRSAGAICLNQCPILAGVNTAPGVLARLFEDVSFAGTPQYYVFQCRPTDGNGAFIQSLGDAFATFQREVSFGSGLARTARFCVAHRTGKIQVLAREGEHLLMSFLHAAESRFEGLQFWQSAHAHAALPPET